MAPGMKEILVLPVILNTDYDLTDCNAPFYILFDAEINIIFNIQYGISSIVSKDNLHLMKRKRTMSSLIYKSAFLIKV